MNSIFFDPDKRIVNKDFITAKMQEIGAAFRTIRTKLSIKQSDLAKSAEIGQDKVSRVENAMPYEMSTLIRLCEALGVDMKITFQGKVKGSSTLSLRERKDYEKEIEKLELEVANLKERIWFSDYVENLRSQVIPNQLLL